MEKIGIICEYNPFHNGHIHHLEKIKEMYPDSLIVLVMSGYFTERGDISLISKYNKTKLALLYGVDLVIELPVLYSSNSADIFASSSVKALKYAKVDKLIFGSELNDIETLKKCASIQLNDKTLSSKLKKHLKEGMNYPTALSKALDMKLDSNDILGVAYIKAIMDEHSTIEPITIKRTSSFNDLESNDTIISAENIREKLKNHKDISKYIPNYDISLINTYNKEKMFELLKYKIWTDNQLNSYLGVDEGIENRIKSVIDKCSNMEELVMAIKSKRYTYVRIKRMLLHILLGIKKEDINEVCQEFRVLGFSPRGQKYLKTINSPNLVYKSSGRVREIEINTAKVYGILTNDNSIQKEFLNKPVKDVE